jgi:PhzF family phenazine biosynthesis protein
VPCPFYIVDAFANRPFAGNPAAVCILTHEKDRKWMQSVAAEANLSETAFVRKFGDLFELKWFTPVAEVDLCGHATLATAHVLWETHGHPIGTPIIFETLSGKLTATKSASWISLDFPALSVDETSFSGSIPDLFGVNPIFTGRSRFDHIIEVASEQEVRNAVVDFTALSKYSSVRGWILTARSEAPEYDFISRFFAPSVGVNEDPVTGSAHCVLGPYWSKRLGDRSELTGYQASKRGGCVQVSTRGFRVIISGQAVTVVAGQIF